MTNAIKMAGNVTAWALLYFLVFVVDTAKALAIALYDKVVDFGLGDEPGTKEEWAAALLVIFVCAFMVASIALALLWLL